jgi:hypothetical protein
LMGCVRCETGGEGAEGEEEGQQGV